MRIQWHKIRAAISGAINWVGGAKPPTPPPPNIDCAHAIELGPLSNTITQNVNANGITYTVWYKYTAQPGDYVVGIFAFGDLVAYTPKVTVFGPNTCLSEYLGLDDSLIQNTPFQLPVVPGDVYYFRITSTNGNVASAILTINGQQAPELPYPVGSIYIPDDTGNFPLTVISAVDGSVLHFYNVPAAEAGDITNDGHFCIDDENAGNFAIYDYQVNLLATIGNGTFTSMRVSTNKIDKFYLSPNSNPATVLTCNLSGALGPTIGPFAGVGITGLGPSPDESILYYTGLNGKTAAPVKRWNIPGNTGLSDLAAGIASYNTEQIVVLNDGTILVLYVHTGSTPFDVMVKRYSAAGATLNTYAFGNSTIGDNRICRALDDPNSFWVWIHIPTTQSKFSNIKASDGTVIHTFTVHDFEGGIYNDPVSATPQRFGTSSTCPFFLYRAPQPPPPPPITIIPPIVPNNPPAICGTGTVQLFTLNGTNFPVPPTVTAFDPNGNVIAGLVVVSATPTQIIVALPILICGNTCFQVNGSSLVCIMINPGTYSGIYYIHPFKTNDTLWSYIYGATGSVGPVSMTQIVAIPNPYFVI